MTSNKHYNNEYKLPLTPQIAIINDIYKIQYKQNKSLKICYLNARSIWNKIDDIQHTLNTISQNNKNRSVHIIAITEHWINTEEAKLFTFENHSTVLSTRISKKGGGSGIFIKKNSCIYDVIKQYSDDENSITSIKIKYNNEQYIITCIYRAPTNNTNKTDQFFQILANYLKTIGNIKHYCIGDFNINMLKTIKPQ